MSYTIFIQKFQDKKEDNFNLNELRRIVDKYGQIRKEEFGLEIIIEKDELFKNADLNGNGSTEITNISIHRPSENPKLRELIFDILKIEGTCFFDQELNFVITRENNANKFPEDLLENCKLAQVKTKNELIDIF